MINFNARENYKTQIMEPTIAFDQLDLHQYQMRYTMLRLTETELHDSLINLFDTKTHHITTLENVWTDVY